MRIIKYITYIFLERKFKSTRVKIIQNTTKKGHLFHEMYQSYVHNIWKYLHIFQIIYVVDKINFNNIPNEVHNKITISTLDRLINNTTSQHLPTVELCPTTDLAFMPFSSGTTGRPKGIMLSHHNMVAITKLMSQWVFSEYRYFSICSGIRKFYPRTRILFEKFHLHPEFSMTWIHQSYRIYSNLEHNTHVLLSTVFIWLFRALLPNIYYSLSVTFNWYCHVLN